MAIKRHWAYFKYVIRHKYYVFVEGIKIGMPFLFLLLHDLSKFLPSEWGPYAATFYNEDGSKRYLETPEFEMAWNHHQKGNKHHWQYWMLTWDRGDTICLPIPNKYLYEMWIDWRGAGRAITGNADPAAWYLKNRDNIKLHPETRWVIEQWCCIDKTNWHNESAQWYTELLNNNVERYYSYKPLSFLSKLLSRVF